MSDLKTYIGVKRIQAEPQERNGKPGYRVIYEPDGYESWSPKDMFEVAYLPKGSLRRHRNSIPIGGRPSSAPTFFLWISGLPARNGITSLSAERMNQVLLPIVILGIIFTLLLTILRKGWSPIYPQ